MNKDEYISAVDQACSDAKGGGDQWNKLFLKGLDKRGLVLRPAGEDRGVEHYIMAPWPFPEGEPQWGESWIVEKA